MSKRTLAIFVAYGVLFLVTALVVFSQTTFATTIANSPGGSDTQIQYNDGGSFGGVSTLTFNDGTSALTMSNAAISGSTLTTSTANDVTFVSATLRASETNILWYQSTLSDLDTVTLTGSGASSATYHSLTLNSGGTAGSTARRNPSTSGMGWSLGKATGVLNWSKPGVLVWRFEMDIVGTANGISRFLFGRDGGEGAVACDTKCVGWELRNQTLYRDAHDGTTLTSASLSETISATTMYVLTVTWDGLGNVTWYLNGVSKGSCACGPTGDSTNGNTQPEIHTLNGADAASQAVRVNELLIGIGQ